MLIKILICIFAVIFFFISGYLWFHRQTGFLLFTPDRHPQIGTLLTFWAIELFIVGLLAIAGLFSLVVMVIALIVGCLSGMLLGLTLVRFMN
ncbi:MULTISPECIES: hypothetical protein [Furfurilactobacillus]|uniref:Uncharacterized protein n=1 Tax=Furfurilactobacillus rossiae TaxID=231049 RepID=A0A7C9IWV5_9LACO|nr:hypothetical protein [Furfurilactobacillus milii]MYV04475.1 hypothetical protein [Furfurilactobacillus milii]